MKKLIQISLVILLSLSNIAISQAAPNYNIPDDATKDQIKAFYICVDIDSAENCEYIWDDTSSYSELPDISKPDNLPGPNIDSDASGQDVQDYIRNNVLPKLASRLITIVTIISIFMLVFAGVKFVTAVGTEDKIKEAKNTAIYAIVGLAVALSSYLIVSIINNINLS